ncbi:MAG: hypothetical protein N4A49_09925 [Marinifilaceae bacterium]|jgi:hypothetical protein|nr:hypothetical protein [Marinifilaceae bacterium]
MIKLKRHIKVEGQEYEVWLGMIIKKKGLRSKISMYYYTENPFVETSTNHSIPGTFESKQKAVAAALRYLKSMYKEMLNREREIEKDKEK